MSIHRNGSASPARLEEEAVICRMPSGIVSLANMQYLAGYCILMAEPQVPSLNEMDPSLRERFLLDMSLVGDALLEVTGAIRINYGIAGNNLPLLHAHIVPRYSTEPERMLHNNPWAYPKKIMQGRPFDPDRDASLRDRLSMAILKLLR